MVVFLFIFMAILPSAQAVNPAQNPDAELVAESLVPLLERTVEALDRHRRRHLQGELSAIELSMVTLSERTRFENSALKLFRENHIDGRRTLIEFGRDPIMRDVRDAFQAYGNRKISLEALIKRLIHERVTVEAFLSDPELGYSSFKGFLTGS